MKKKFASLFFGLLFCGLTYAQTFIENVPITGATVTTYGYGPYSDSFGFTTTAAGPATIVVKSFGMKISSGGRGSGGVYAYDLVSSVSVFDASGNSVCSPAQSQVHSPTQSTTTVTQWTCQAGNLAVGSYTIVVNGTAFESTGNSAYVPYYVQVIAQ